MKLFLNIIFVLATFFVSATNQIPQDKKLILTKINGKQVDGTFVYLTINEENKTISGKSGCNSFNMSFTAYDNKTCIKTGTAISTLMACDESLMKLENEFLNTIKDRKFKITLKDNQVHFKNWWGRSVLIFEVQTEKSILDFIGKNEWKLIQMNNVGKDYGKSSIKFDLKENKVSGSNGCNNFFGTYKVEENYMIFSQMGATKMACLDDEVNKTEREFMNFLSKEKLRFDVADQTLNFYVGDKLVLMFGIVK